MPLARIDMIRGSPGNVACQAMVDTLKAPENDRFQVISEDGEEDFVHNPHLFGVERSKACVFIQLFLRDGRTAEQKQGCYRKVVDDLNGRLGVRPEDVFISPVSTAADEWSFGNGVASLVK